MPVFPAILRRAASLVLRAPPPDVRAGPTIAMYFAGPLEGLIASPETGDTRPIRRLTPTLFAAGTSAVLIRYGGRRELQLLAALRPKPLYYVIDDDFFAAAPGDGLPAAYRRRLKAFRDGPLRQLLPMVSHVVAPSSAILAGYPVHNGLLLGPTQCHAPAALDHHDRQETFDIVAAGTQAHLRDLGHIAPALARFLRQTPEARLTTLLGGAEPEPLRGLANTIHHGALPWPAYRRFVAANRFHVALALTLDTAFNRARSVSKVHDHAGFGAAGLYSARAPFRGIVQHGRTGLLLGDDPADWVAALRSLAANRALTRGLASGGQNLSASLGDPARVRAFWIEALGLSPASP
jgi:hypothetical protein